MTTSFRDKKKFATVHGKQMAYIEEGTGDPIVFLHGNPMSSYLWRNVMPHLAGKGRLIAPDLIGMGDSDKLDNSGPDSYTFVEQRKYLFALLEQLGVTDNVTLVIHDWGSGLGFHWAHTHPEAVKGIAFMEAIVETRDRWDQFPDRAREMFQALRSPAGEEMVLEKNLFVEALVPGSILRDLTEEEMNEYRRPFANAGEDRRPCLCRLARQDINSQVLRQCGPRRVDHGGGTGPRAQLAEHHRSHSARIALHSGRRPGRDRCSRAGLARQPVTPPVAPGADRIRPPQQSAF